MDQAPTHQTEWEWHVAVHGDDGAAGTKERPWATPERARLEIRRCKAEQGERFGGATVILHDGVYERRVTFELLQEDSGMPGAPVVYRAAEGACPRLAGGSRIRGFEPVRDLPMRQRLSADAQSQVRAVFLPALGIDDWGVMRPRGFGRPYVNASLEVFVNGTPMILPRWPHGHCLHTTTILDAGTKLRYGETGNRGAEFHYTDTDRPATWKPDDNLWVQGIFGTVWADDMIRIAQLDPVARRIRLADTHLYGVQVPVPHAVPEFQFVNVFEELNTPGEYYLDHATGWLYLYPPVPLDDAEVMVSRMEDPVVAMQDVSHVTLSGLTIEAARGMGLYMEGGEFNRIEGCTFRNLGSAAICMGQGIAGDDLPTIETTGTPVSRRIGNYAAHLYGNPEWNRLAGRNHLVTRCIIEDTGEGGVILGGGDRRTLTPANNQVTHCRIRRVNRLTKTYRPGIYMDGVGNRAAYNDIQDLTHSAIIAEGNEHVMEFNRIRNVLTASDDGGAIYMGRDIAQHGTVIRFNLISVARGGPCGFRLGIYLDDQCGGVDVIGNVIIGCPASILASGRYIRVLDNVQIDCDNPIQLDGRPTSAQHLHVLERLRVDEEPWISRYPQVARAPREHWNKTVGMEARRNIRIGGPPFMFNLGVDESFLTLEDNQEWPAEG